MGLCVYPLPELYLLCVCGNLRLSTDYPNMMSSLVFFPQDTDDLSQLYSFTIDTLEAIANNYDAYITDNARYVGLASIFQTLGFDFTPAMMASYGIIAPNRYEELFAPICTNCTMITIGKIGKGGLNACLPVVMLN